MNRRWIVIAGALLLLSIVGFLVWQQITTANAARPQFSAADVAIARTGTLIATVSATGAIEPGVSTTLSFLTGGNAARVLVKRGDKVAAGQSLAQLDTGSLELQVNQAQANLAAAQARLDRLRTGSRPEEKLKDKAAVLQAEANLKNAEAEFQRTESLYRSGVSSKSEYDRALANRDSAAALLQAARQSSAMTDIGPRKEEIRAAEAEVQQMRAALDYANTQLAATEIKAPVTGTVLQRIVERGEMVSPSAFGGSGARTSVVDLADLTDLQVELDISQTDFARLKSEQRAEIIPEAYPNLRFTGFIEEIAPEANRAKSTVQVKVKVENPNEQLRPEMNARVNFLADKPSATENKTIARVLVPKTAVVKKDDSSFVFVVKGNRVEQRTIRTGEESGDAYVVLDGLSGNESVAVAGVDKLRDGDRVKVQ